MPPSSHARLPGALSLSSDKGETGEVECALWRKKAIRRGRDATPSSRSTPVGEKREVAEGAIRRKRGGGGETEQLARRKPTTRISRAPSEHKPPLAKWEEERRTQKERGKRASESKEEEETGIPEPRRSRNGATKREEAPQRGTQSQTWTGVPNDTPRGQGAVIISCPSRPLGHCPGGRITSRRLRRRPRTGSRRGPGLAPAERSPSLTTANVLTKATRVPLL